jgi:hypothetical protein
MSQDTIPLLVQKDEDTLLLTFGNCWSSVPKSYRLLKRMCDLQDPNIIMMPTDNLHTNR